MGFMDAPLIGPANIASSNTVPPMARPANIPCSFEPVATWMITSIRKKVRITSSTNDCKTDPCGSVEPSNSLFTKRTFSIAPAIAFRQRGVTRVFTLVEQAEGSYFFEARQARLFSCNPSEIHASNPDKSCKKKILFKPSVLFRPVLFDPAASDFSAKNVLQFVQPNNCAIFAVK